MNDVLDTLNLARAAIASGVEYLALIFTGKAIRPTSVMDVSKRVSELILKAMVVSPANAARDGAVSH
jgi:FlaA1/EpsC-like NDP-sugar epimerase